MIRETRKICQKAFWDFSVSPLPSPLTSIVGNFHSKTPKPENSGLLTGPTLFCCRTMDDQTANHGWPRSVRIIFLAKNTADSLPWIPSPSGIISEVSYHLWTALPRSVSTSLYQLLITPPADHKLPYITSWERERGLKLTEKQVDILCFLTSLRSVPSTKRRVSRYWTGGTIPRQRSIECFPNGDLWWRCGEDIGSFLHIFWSCWLLQSYWTEVHRIKLNIFKCSITNSFFYLCFLPIVFAWLMFFLHSSLSVFFFFFIQATVQEMHNKQLMPRSLYPFYIRGLLSLL